MSGAIEVPFGLPSDFSSIRENSLLYGLNVLINQLAGFLYALLDLSTFGEHGEMLVLLTKGQSSEQ